MSVLTAYAKSQAHYRSERGMYAEPLTRQDQAQQVKIGSEDLRRVCLAAKLVSQVDTKALRGWENERG